MTRAEKRLYHQIHPIKLLTDVSTAFGATILLWKGLLLYAVLLAFIPSLLVSALLITSVDLEPYRNTPFGRYFNRYLGSRLTDILRLCGFFAMALGGWLRSPWLIFTGLAGIALCWSYGILLDQWHKST